MGAPLEVNLESVHNYGEHTNEGEHSPINSPKALGSSEIDIVPKDQDSS